MVKGLEIKKRHGGHPCLGMSSMAISSMNAIAPSPAPSQSTSSMLRLRWMPRLDSDQCVRLQGALCYRYTTGQCGASRGNRTLMSSLEGWRSAVEQWMRFGRPQCQRQVIQSPLRSPACPSDDASTQRRLGACRTRQLVGEGGLEPPTKTL